MTEADGKPVLQEQATSETSHTAVYQVPEGRLPNGDCRWRIRVQDEPLTSE